jgi:hypothetical protein
MSEGQENIYLILSLHLAEIEIANCPMEPYGQSPCLHAKALRCASAKASEGYPAAAKSAEAAIVRCVKYLEAFCAFIHGHSPRPSAQADKVNYD